MSGKAYRWIPAPSAILVDSKGVASLEMFGYLDEVARRMGGQTGIENNRLLFSNQGVYTGAIVGTGLNLDRTTNTLTATGAGFPEAPLDGRQYGRQMAEWTVIVTATSVGGAAAPPRYSIQYNDPLGTFAGNADFLFDQTGKYVRIGTVVGSPYTIEPVVQTIAATAGVDLKIRGGNALSTANGGDLYVQGGTSGITSGTGGGVQINAGNGVGLGGNVNITSGQGGSGAANSGTIQILTGTTTGAGTGSGAMTIQTGPTTSTTHITNTGAITLRSGASSGTSAGGSGNVTVGTGGGFGSGTLILNTGASPDGVSGNITITTGAAGAGTSGDIIFTPGTGTIVGTIQFGGFINLTGTANRLRGDFSNATINSRTLLQHNVNGNFSSDVGVIPRGTATLAYWTAYNNSTPTNSAIARLGVDVTAAYLDSSRVGTGTSLDLLVRTGNTPTERMRVDTLGNVVVNTAAIATNATDGFLYVPTCAGTPTGTPTTFTGRAPIVVDTTNNKLYFYSGGAWRDAGP